METPVMQFKDAWENRLNTIPLGFRLALGNLPAGEYLCQVTVLNPDDRKAAFWRAPIYLMQPEQAR
jgi:hypothetical protein